MFRSIQRPIFHPWRSHRLALCRLLSTVPERRESQVIPNWSKLFNSFTNNRAEVKNIWNPKPSKPEPKRKPKREEVDPKELKPVVSNTPFEELLKSPVPLDSHNLSRTTFIEACRKGDIAIVKKFLKTKALSLLQHCPKGRTALVEASKNGHFEVVRLLVAANPSHLHLFQQSKPFRRTALMEASLNGHSEIVRFLLMTNSSSGHMHIKDSSNKTAFVLATTNGHNDVRNIFNTQNALNQANKKKRSLVEAAEKGNIDAVKLILSKNSSLGKLLIKGESGGTALMEASKNGHLMIVKYLLATNSSDAHLLAECNGRTARTEAIQNGHKQIAKLLKSRKATTP